MNENASGNDDAGNVMASVSERRTASENDAATDGENASGDRDSRICRKKI